MDVFSVLTASEAPSWTLYSGVPPTLMHWLHALPIASCGRRLDDEAVRVAIGPRLGLEICAPHQCHCGAQVDAYGDHGFVCKRARSAN